VKLKDVMKKVRKRRYPDPLKALPMAQAKDFADYAERRRELLTKGMKWFRNRVRRWNQRPRIDQLSLTDVEVRWADGKEFKFGSTTLRFTQPLFHGIEFSRVGWVIGTLIECRGEKFIHSSDLNGIYIEDYAQLLIEEDPHLLILDGPPTYTMGFMLNRTNLSRCVTNVCEVIRRSKNLQLVLYDHHLLREKRYKEWTSQVWLTGKRKGVKIMTAAEYLGKRPVIEKL
jgi:hypothetical protein